MPQSFNSGKFKMDIEKQKIWKIRTHNLFVLDGYGKIKTLVKLLRGKNAN